MKRGNDKSQLSKEEYEAQEDAENDDEGMTPGTFKRASADVMAGRKIIKVKRGGSSGSALQSNSGGLNLTVPTKPDTNAFTGFNGFNASAATNTAKLSYEENEQTKKIRKLNESFLKWAQRQIDTHPLSIWKEGVKDYIKHCEAIEKQYSKNGDTKSNGETKHVQAPAAPASNPFGGISLKPAATTTPSLSFGTTSSAPTAPTTTSTTTTAPVAAASPFAGFSFGAAAKPVPAPATTAPAAAPAAFGGFGSSPAPIAPTSTATTAPAAKPLGSFSFSAAPASTTTPAPSFSSSFSFGGASAATGTTVPSFGGFTAPPAAATASAGGGEDEEGGEDEGEPILEPEKVLRNAADTDEILHDVPCKLFTFSLDSKEWKDTGKGTFRITRDPVSKKQRMLVRNEVGRINFNAGFFPTMKIERVQKRIKFAAFVTVEDTSVGADGKTAVRTEMKNFMIQVKPENLDATLKKMEDGVASTVK